MNTKVRDAKATARVRSAVGGRDSACSVSGGGRQLVGSVGGGIRTFGEHDAVGSGPAHEERVDRVDAGGQETRAAIYELEVVLLPAAARDPLQIFPSAYT